MKNFLKIAVASAVALCACSDGDKVAGTATDTENMITAEVSGSVVRTDGSYAKNAVVRMARIYDESENLSVPEFVEVRTDTTGVFAFDSAIADTFQLAVVDEDAEEISYMPRVTAASKEDFEKIKLEKAAVFGGVLFYEEVTEPAVPVGSHFMVYMPGMPFTQSVFAGDSFSMMIPAGTWWFGFCPGDPQIVAKLKDSGVADSLIYRVWNMDSVEVEPGDTLLTGPFLWSTESEVDSLMNQPEEQTPVSRISGRVACKNAKECAGVEVMAITDLFGFGFAGDVSEFVAETTTDSLGRWWLPVPSEIPADSFRVEFRAVGKVPGMGLSRYVMKSEVEDLEDTLDLGTVELSKPSGLNSRIALVIDKQDSSQSDNCMMNSVVIGAKGTAHFVRAVTCKPLSIAEIPSGEQELVLYSGDAKVISTLQDAEMAFDEYVVSVFVNLPEGDVLEWQGMTYTPPALPKSVK